MEDKLEVEVQDSMSSADKLIQPVGDDGATTADPKLRVGDDGAATAVESPQPVVEDNKAVGDAEQPEAVKDEADADKARWHQRSLETCTDITNCSEAVYTKLMGLYNLAQPDASGTLAKLTKIHNDLERLLAGLV